MELQGYRRELDRIDGELTRLFAERMELSAQVAAYKKERGLNTLDVSREVAMFASVEASLPEELRGCGTALYTSILELSRAHQERESGVLPENIVLTGMPGSGKKTVGRLAAERLGRPFVSSDALVETMTGRTIPDIFARLGEDAFRALETRALALCCARMGCVVATGGGSVTRPENLPLLRRCGRIVWVRREIDDLAKEGRPLSQSRDLREMYAEREPLYRGCAELTIDNDGTVDEAAEQLIALLT